MSTTTNLFILILLVFATIALASAFLVILTFILFPDLRNSPFMTIIAFISASDFLGNIPYLRLKRPHRNSPRCFMQAFFNSALYPCSWIWTTILVYFLFQLATEKKVPRITIYHHLLGWAMPIVIFLIQTPFTTFEVNEILDFEVCTIEGAIGGIYHVITYYGMFFSCIFTMFYLRYRISLLIASKDSGVLEPSFLVAKSASSLYPLAILICWVPHIVTLCLAYLEASEAFDIAYLVGDILKILHASVTAGIFFYKSQEARKCWYKLLFGNLGNKHASVNIRTISEAVESQETENYLHFTPSFTIKASLHENEMSQSFSKVDIDAQL